MQNMKNYYIMGLVIILSIILDCERCDMVRDKDKRSGYFGFI